MKDVENTITKKITINTGHLSGHLYILNRDEPFVLKTFMSMLKKSMSFIVANMAFCLLSG